MALICRPFFLIAPGRAWGRPVVRPAAFGAVRTAAFALVEELGVPAILVHSKPLDPPELAEALASGASALVSVDRIDDHFNSVLRSVAQGYSIKQTARVLGIAPKTVENVQTRLFRKLGVRNRSGALAVADAFGLLPASPPVPARSGPPRPGHSA